MINRSRWNALGLAAFVRVSLAVAVLMVPAVLTVMPTADAQIFKRDKDKPSIFRRIFRRDEIEEIPEEPVRRLNRSSSQQSATSKQKVISLKDENARKVLVAGDFLAGSLAKGLVVAFADEKSIVIVNRSQPSSGVVRDEVFNWPESLRRELDSGDYAAVVFLIGTNDRQGFRSTSPRIALSSDDWTPEYIRRAVDLSQILSSTSTRPFWVGMPPVRPKKLNAHGIAASSIFRQQAAKQNITYIDLFNAFTDEAGNFVRKGPDIDGQPRTLRTKDGINFTKTGRRKLAWYVEQHLKRLLLDGSQLIASAGDLNSAIGVSEAVAIGPVLSLNVSSDYAIDTLAGEGPLTEYTNANSAQYRRLVAGLSLPLTPGRVDDFRLTRSGVSELQQPSAVVPISANRRDVAARADLSETQ